MFKNKAVAVLMMAGLLSLTPSASAGVIFNFTGVITGGTPVGASPWLRITFANSGANNVTMTIHNLLPTGSQFITDLFVNVDPARPLVTRTYVSGQDVSAFTAVTPGNRGNPAIGSTYELEFNWATANNVNRFTGGENAVFNLSATGLTENSFTFTSTSNNGNNFMSSHVQGIPVICNEDEEVCSADSSKIRPGQPTGSVPEPATLSLFGLAGGLGLLVRKLRS